ncbi:MAG: fatty acid desaturase [Myxococcales bacterium]|nr:fatty acid desaturase [Myxococcales bacterium]
MAGMDAVPKEVLRAAYERKAFHNPFKISLAFAAWAGIAVLLYQTQSSPYFIPIGIACSIMVAYLIRGLGAIAHDAVHGNVARGKLAGYLVSLLCWAPTGMSVTIYANYHLHHHRIANTYPDVDNFVVTDYTTNPFLAKLLLLAVYTFGYPIYFMFNMFRYVQRLTAWERIRMNLELALWWGLVALVAYLMPLQVFFFFYGLPFILGSFLASCTSMIEHFQMPETDDDAYSSRTYGTRCHITNFIWNNVTYHNEHHKYPGIPWYNLKSFHRAAYPDYDDQVKSAVHPSIFPLALSLYGQILKLDIAEIERKYADIKDKKAAKAESLGLPGIPVEA